ncbi:efflux RND transporter permease subunit [Phenylobacterium sp.]|jgi:multidrug efflux pump subunit AcrB|uniref:efflux RND transporter permease subunit n=1 Tax=Phenylobacterium sp. TaxID=1871053 RepID=UPI002E31A13E|nr:efflux RND transporter permease subunit [Phenylobacterium sp.]HEX4709825.1 efflux RND transporter permease subunit [Phenylobacterium sp.]
MLAIVRLALRRPYTFVVLAILILIFGPLAAMRTPTDIFPEIRIPVIAAVWTYRGLPADDMSGRVIYYYERQLSSSVNDIEHIESQSLPGVGIVKIFFQPGVDIRTATAQVTSLSQTVLKQMPPGITPPLILNYNASTVPILQMALSSSQITEQKLYDSGQNFLRPALASVAGASVPSPYGGRERQIQIDLDPQALQSKGLSAQDVGAALAAQNQIVPAGTAKVGSFEYNVKLNNSPEAIEDLNDLPIKTVGGTTIYIRDVAHVRDGYPPQRNEVRVDGRRAVLMSILKSGSSSTLAIISGVKSMLPKLKEGLPASLHIALLNDQSIFVKAAVSGVVKEGVIAAALTSLMILLFLGSWRSTVIIATSIPLAVLSSIAALSAMGQTLNIMTLGGLALAVGILVDDATVTIENINWHLEQGKDVKSAILDGAAQIVTPAFVSLLCICIVFVPMFFLQGVAGFLFVPMAEAVMFAMIASFVLSRTLVPTLAMYLLKPHDAGHTQFMMESHGHGAPPRRSRHALVRFQHGFEQRFTRLREGYRGLLATALENRRRFIVGFLACVVASFALEPLLGSNFFPSVDSGAITLHVRAPVGTRLEDTAALFDRVEAAVRHAIPPDQLKGIVDNIGLPVSGINRAYSNTGGIGPQDGDIYITLAEKHRPTGDYVRSLRISLPKQFPGSTFSFLPADIISQILNFGAPAPIDVQVAGPNRDENEAYADEVMTRMKLIPGLADVRRQQSTRYPELRVNVDRTQADKVGLTERDVTTTLSTTLAGSFQTAPAFWLNPKNGVSYPIVVQSPQQDVNTLSKLQNIPISGGKSGDMQILGGLATIDRGDSDAVVSHYAIQPSFDIYATPQDRDLGGVAKAIQKILKDTAKDLPKGATVTLRGQVNTMNSAFLGLSLGLLGAVVLIYLLIVVNFQSWIDPFVIITALPAALAGILWMLFATQTPLSVPALTGAIMCMGVATANSILVVSFARERLEQTGDAVVAAMEAGFTRFRPVLMTALAMIIGMAPMALGLGEGGEQNAPLGRAVIGGLIFATFATLLFVPVVFSLAHARKAAPATAPDNLTDPDLGDAYAQSS